MDLEKEFPRSSAIQREIESRLYTGSVEQRIAAHQELMEWSIGGPPPGWRPDILEDRGDTFCAEHHESFGGAPCVIELGFAKSNDATEQYVRAAKLGLCGSVWQLRELHRLEAKAIAEGK